MIAAFRHQRLRATFVWLALAAVLLRGLLPSGYMPAHAANGPAGIQMVLCSGGQLVADGQQPGGHHPQKNECPFAFSAMATIPPAPAPLHAPDGHGAMPAADVAPSFFPASLRVRPPARAPPHYS